MLLRNRCANLAQDLVADIVAPGIVDRLEVVDVGDQQRQRPAPLDGLRDQRTQWPSM